MFGIAGSGKTCSLCALLGKKPPEDRHSTPLMERPIGVSVISVDEELKWQEMTPEQVRQRIADIIRSRSKTPSKVTKSSPSGDHTNQREYSPAASHLHPPTMKGASVASDDPPIPQFEPEEITDPLLESLFKEYASLINTSRASDKPILQQNWLYIIDSGGQHEFHEVLSMFLNRVSHFIYVFRVHDNLDERPNIAFYDSGNKLHEYSSFFTNEEIFKHCMCTMHSFTSKHKGDNKDKNECSSPRILILGTHRDKVKEEDLPQKLKSLNERLEETLISDMEKDQVIFCNKMKKDFVFTINAQTPDKRDLKCAEAIRKFLSEKPKGSEEPRRSEKHNWRHVQVPLRWHALEQRLRMEKGSKVLSKHRCHDIAKALEISDESCEEALTFFNDLNLLFYWPNILPDLVFLEPQVILDSVSELVRESYQLKQGDTSDKVTPTVGDHKLQYYGVVTKKSLKEYGEHYEPPLFTSNELIKLLESLLVFAKLSSDEWFMPSLLEVVSENVAQYRLSQQAALVIHFPNGEPRMGMFCCLVAFVLSLDNTDPCPWELSKKGKSIEPECVYRNVIKFRVKGDSPGSVTMIDYFTHFEVHVKPAYKMVGDDLWKLAYNAVFRGLKRASKILHCTDCTYEHAIICPECSSTPHPATVNKGGWVCSENQDIGRNLDLTTNDIPWLRLIMSASELHFTLHDLCTLSCPMSDAETN